MKNFKKIFLSGTITLATLFTMSAVSNAATVKITGEVVNIRKGASENSSVIAQLSENIECEYLGEEGNWYKIKYKNYTGYVTKEYSELVDEISDDSNEQTDSNNQTSNQADENTDSKDDNQNNNSSDNSQNDDSQSTDTSSQEGAIKLTYKKFNTNTIIKILPLIHSSNIGETKKNEEVLVLAETSGWTYIQTDEISGWVRTDTLGSSKTVSTGTSNQNVGTTTTTEKTGYISEEEVNMRKGAGTTYAVIKTLKLNAQVTIIKEQGSWYQIKSGSDTGYVSKDYVSESKIVSNRSLSEPRTDEVTKDNTESEKQSESKDSSKETTSKSNSTSSSKNNTSKTNTAISNTNTTSKSKNDTSNKTNTTTSKSQTTSSSDTIKDTDVIAYAKKYLGHKYVWGADGTNGTFDCSGFTMYVYNHFGVSLPHYTVSQYNSKKGTKITKQSDLKMGDIVFLTDYETGEPCGHCGIYISDGDFIHADSSVGYVNISNLNGIYKDRFCGALRIIK